MKGIVFTEFMDFVEQGHGADMVDDMVEMSDLPSGGAYTSVGTYPHTEMGELVGSLTKLSGMRAETVLIDFGKHLSRRFARSFPGFFSERTGLFDFLESVDGHIHVEVRKLYPDAELPGFVVNSRTDREMQFDYTSCRPLGALAKGLILGAAEHYGEKITIGEQAHAEANRRFVRFSIERVH
jgi:hypothetical protein